MSNSTKVMMIAVIALAVIAIFSAQVYALGQFIQVVTPTSEPTVSVGASASATPATVDYGCSTNGTITICTNVQYNVEVPTYVAPVCDTCTITTERRVLSQEEVEALYSR